MDNRSNNSAASTHIMPLFIPQFVAVLVFPVTALSALADLYLSQTEESRTLWHCTTTLVPLNEACPGGGGRRRGRRRRRRRRRRRGRRRKRKPRGKEGGYSLYQDVVSKGGFLLPCTLDTSALASREGGSERGREGEREGGREGINV